MALLSSLSGEAHQFVMSELQPNSYRVRNTAISRLR